MTTNLKNAVIGVVGLGYVGLPMALSFAKKYKVVGYDSNSSKIESYKQGIDVTKEIGSEELKKTRMTLSSCPEDLKECDFIIVAVPTPVDSHHLPNTSPLEKASETVGKYMKKGCIVIYESTVYPGLTEELCMPILERFSNMQCGVDFKIAYSPERINPGDKVHTFETITKIVSGMDSETLDVVAELYESILKNGVYKASSIKVAEAAKVIENTQRDVNIAFMNELSKIFHTMNIDTNEVLAAARSKWNFLDFKPGLVGGHCIGVDPFYLIEKSQAMGYRSELLIKSREINDSMGKFIADNVIKYFIEVEKNIKHSVVLIEGITFKPNVSDIRNSKVIDIIRHLQDYGVKTIVKDPYASLEEVKEVYDIDIQNDIEEKVDVVIFAVDHEDYKKMTISSLNSLFKDQKCVFDIKNIFCKKQLLDNDFYYWSL